MLRLVHGPCLLWSLLGAATFLLAASLAAPAATATTTEAPTVSVSESGRFVTTIVLQTRAVAVKETGPKATVKKFGEVYAWSPSFFAVRQNQPTQIRFWNLQPDDYHTFELIGPDSHKLVQFTLPPLSDTSHVFTFHRPGLYRFECTIHEPEMVGQILVLPASDSGS